MFPTKENIKNIEKLIEQGYINKRKHPEISYFIYNYTSACQYDRKWNEETLNCRGLILDENYKVIARGMPKFFNYEEYGNGSNLGELAPYKSFEITEKLDGSLGILYRMSSGEPRISTRGNFESVQAKVATEILKEKYKKQLYTFKRLNNLTFIFEIIYKNNRIVVDYGNTKDIVLLAIINNETGKEDSYDELSIFSKRFEIPLVKKYDGIKDFTTIKRDLARDNAEGFVVKFDTGLRVKLKFEEYVRLHRLITGVSNKSIWDLLRNGQDIDELLDKVPDEFYNWVASTKNDFEERFKAKRKTALTTLQFHANRINCGTRKEIAKIFNKYPKQERSILFAMLDKKPYDHIIWRQIRPKYAVPFKKEI